MPTYDPDDSLADAEALQIGIAIPGPLSGRLDALVARAHATGERTNRKELLAALILAASDSDRQLTRLVRRYRRARVADAFVPGMDPAVFLEPVRPRGPRRTPRRIRPRRARRRRPGGGTGETR
jgi:hypothetical protein